nr:HAD-IA family hydrolase [Clostridia bacterium]
MIEVSAGIVYNRDGRILICQRGEGRSNAHLWEFPGGKREAGESAVDCLVRELQEELSLPVTDVRAETSYAHDNIEFTFLTAKTDALPVLTEHEDARFVTARELLHFDLCPADRPMAELIAFRQVYHIFWDFDGTLLDSYPVMVRAFVAAAADFGIEITQERTLSLMKVNLTHCCETVGAENNIEVSDLLMAFRRHEQVEMANGLPPVEGIPEEVKFLHNYGIRHYVATHRDLQCRELLEKAGLLHYFTDFVTAEDKLPRKPAPDMLLHLMGKHGLDPAQCMMVGDRPLDTQAGMAAGVLSVLLDVDDRFPDGDCDVRIPAPWYLSHNIT